MKSNYSQRSKKLEKSKHTQEKEKALYKRVGPNNVSMNK
jgi:hypothetical protein